MTPSILFLVGPTGSGKTEIAIRLARKLNGEIVSADSMLVYRGMNIGTAKPNRIERGGIRHHLMDVVSPRSRFSVDKFRALALSRIQDIVRRKRLPIVVGGSGLYIEALIDGLAPEPSASIAIRNRLESEAKENGIEKLYEKLKLIDRNRANEILPSDKRRIIRALEIFEVCGVRPTEWMKKRISLCELGYSWVMVGLERDRGELYDRVNQRVDRMMERGFLKEVKSLLKTGLSLTAKHAIGYKELIECIKNKMSLVDAVELTKQRSRNLAKKQLTWFRRESRIQWIPVKQNAYNEVVKRIIKIYVGSKN